MTATAQQVEVEVKGKKVKAWATVREDGTVARAFTSKKIGDPQGGAERYAEELNNTLPPSEAIRFVMPETGETFGHIEPHHIPEGFDPACGFLLALNYANLFDSRDECKGCGGVVHPRDQKEHHRGHRSAVSALRAAGKERSQGKKRERDWSTVEDGDPFVIASDMREAGASYREIADEFASRGIKTARGKDLWSTTAVMRLLRS